MNRKDTIIIAVLLNAGVLALLFMLAMNTDEEKVNDHSDILTNTVKLEDTPSERRLELALSRDVEEDEVDSQVEGVVGHSHEIFFPDDDSIVFADKETVKNSSSYVENTFSKSDIIEVTVKRGDALERIARVNGSSVEAIKTLNNLKTERLNIGQVLKVPVNGAVKKTEEKNPVAALNTSNAPKVAEVKPANTPTASAPANDVMYYTLKSGDSPWKIAKQFNVNFDDLLNMNHLDEEKARNLKIGDKIRVR
jgi:LysM repeat protein